MHPQLAQMQRMAGGYSRGSASEAASGLVDKRGNMLPASSSYLQQQAQAEKQRQKDSAWRHYTGEHNDQFFRPTPGQPNLNVNNNRSAPIVDTGIDFLTGKTVTFEVLRDGKPQKDAQKVLDGCWGKDAKRMTLLSKLAQNGGIFGHVFAKIIPPDTSKHRPYCRVVPLDPSQLTVETEQDDCDTVWAYCIEWGQTDTSGKNPFTISYMQIIKRIDPDNDADLFDSGYDPDSTWQILNFRRVGTQDWEMVGDPIDWPHPWAPVHDWQNLPMANQHWGQSDIPENVQHLNSVLNLTLSNINAIAKFYGFPWLWATGVNPNETLDVGPGKLTKFPAPDAKINALEAHGDIPSLINFANDLRSDMDEQTRVPSVATGRLRDVPKVTSGVAFQMMYGPLLGKNTHKQRLYETGYEELSLRMLALCGFGDGTGDDGWEVVTHWPSPLPNDDQATAQLALAAKQIGMSDHFIVSQVLDQDYDTEMEYREDEAKAALKAAMQGAALPDPSMPPGQPQDGQQPPQNNQQQGNSGSMPPQNHPAAVAQQNVMRAAGKAMKAGASK